MYRFLEDSISLFFKKKKLALSALPILNITSISRFQGKYPISRISSVKGNLLFFPPALLSAGLTDPQSAAQLSPRVILHHSWLNPDFRFNVSCFLVFHMTSHEQIF